MTSAADYTTQHEAADMAYFQNFQTCDDIKSEYRRLAMRFHPDHGGDTATMQDINAQYSKAIDQATRNEKPGLSEAEYTDLANVNDLVRAAVEAIINLPEIDIEVCGLWVWVGGNTYPVKAAIKAAGFKWASVKKMWYFAGVPATSHGKMDMDDIRDAHGSTKVKGSWRKGISAAA